jgi:hypothetical protein
MKIQTQMYGSDTADGMAFTGSWPALSAPSFGYPYTLRPIKLKGYYKYSSQKGDSCAFYVYFTKWNNTLKKQDSIGGGGFIGMPQSSYTYFEIPIDYASASTPDTAAIIILASASSTVDQRGLPGDTLIIDELSFELATGIDDPVFSDSHVKTYPNPANDRIIFSGLTHEASEISICDIHGKEIFRSQISNTTLEVDTREFINGIYLYTITDHTGKKETGRFSITK